MLRCFRGPCSDVLCLRFLQLLLPPLPQGSLGPEGRDSMETFDLELAFQGLSLSAHGLVGLIQ